MDVSNASAIITGGASGLGEASAVALAALGARCVIVDMDADLGEKVASEIGGRFVAADVTDPDAVARAVDAACELAPLRALVNAAGISNAHRTVDRGGAPFPLDAFERIISVNLIGSFNCLRLAAAAMAKQEPLHAGDGNRGAVVNLASVAAFDGQIGQAAYSASKGGIVGMTLTIARDLAAWGIRVNTVAPGLIDTPMWGFGPEADQFKAKVGADVLFPRRLGMPAELASMVVELLTNDYMNGEVIRVDAGIRMPPR
jgi:NAD(P)-dependent dehydrogenase (short-subunit alcohol dehydrogenase family)